MARSKGYGVRTGSIGGRGSSTGARVVGGGNGRSQRGVNVRGARQGRHPGMARGKRGRVGG